MTTPSILVCCPLKQLPGSVQGRVQGNSGYTVVFPEYVPRSQWFKAQGASEPEESSLYFVAPNGFCCSFRKVSSCSICSILWQGAPQLDHAGCKSCFLLFLSWLDFFLEVREQCSLFTIFSVIHDCVSPQQTCTALHQVGICPYSLYHSEYNPGQVRYIQVTDIFHLGAGRGEETVT